MTLEYFETIGFVGILFEIFGFILMIKFYNKKPAYGNWKNWQTKHLVNKGFEKYEEKDVAEIEMDHSPKGTSEPVHRGFVTHWHIQSKYLPLGSVIFGLALQGIQLLSD